MTQAELLTTARLKLGATVRQSVSRTDWVLLRTAGGSRRLVLARSQAAILTRCFSSPRTVPEALVQLLGEQACPPLNEYYELVLQAHAAGVLVEGDEPGGRSLARRWPVRLPLRAAGLAGAVLCAAGAVALLIPPWAAPAGWADWVLGWLAACVLLSLGEAAAACVLSGEASEVRGPGLRWLTLLPHFAVDSGDAAMDGREREAAVAALRAMPALAGAALVAWRWPGMLAPVLAAAFYVLAPWRGSAAYQWIHARQGAPRLSVQAGFLFAPRRGDAWERLREWRRGLTTRAALHWLGWTILVALAWMRLFPGATGSLPAWLGPAARHRPLLGAAVHVAGAAAVIAALGVGKAFLSHWWRRRKLARPLREDSALGAPAAPLAGDPLAILRQVALFSELAEDTLAELAGVLQSVEIGKGQDVFREDDPGDAFYVVLSGEVAVLKRRPRPSKRTETIGLLGPGACFGEIALLEGTVRTATVRATRGTHLLKLGKPDFDQLLVRRVGAERVRELLQKAQFLGRLVFLAGWPLDELLRYARQCGMIRFEAGAAVLSRGKPNNFFYLIFDGAFEARDGDRVLRRMRPGDYFGEISLLGNRDATADVVAVEEGRCLTMVRSDFQKLFASDFRIGIRMESLAEQRLAT